MQFQFDGKKLMVSGRGLVVSTTNGETVITEQQPATDGGAAVATGARRGRKPKATAAPSTQTEFNPAALS